MKLLTSILAVLLVASLWYNIRLSRQVPKEEPTQTQEKPQPETSPQPDFQLLQVIHLDDPVPSIERMYNLVPGSKLKQLFVGNINPGSDTAAQISKALKLPITSGKDPFPRVKIDSFVRNSPNGKFIHFANLIIGKDSLGFGSTNATPCAFPEKGTGTGPAKIGQVIPWIKVKGDALQDFNKAATLGFKKCDTFITKRNEGYLIDPAGFLVLIEGPPPG